MLTVSPQMILSPRQHHSSSPRRRGSSTPGSRWSNREAAVYWVARSSRAMTAERVARSSPSPSLPRGDDLDLVAALEHRLGPAAFRQHVVIYGDREMRAFVFELREQRVDAGGGDLPLLPVDGHTHRITSLSMAPRCT